MRNLDVDLVSENTAHSRERAFQAPDVPEPLAFKSERDCLPFPEMAIDFDEIANLLEDDE